MVALHVYLLLCGSMRVSALFKQKIVINVAINEHLYLIYFLGFNIFFRCGYPAANASYYDLSFHPTNQLQHRLQTKQDFPSNQVLQL